MLSITTEKRKRFCTHAKTDENVYCVFSPERFVLVLFAQLSRAVAQHRSSLQILLIIFAYFLFVKLKEIGKDEKLRSGGQYWNRIGPVHTLIKLQKTFVNFCQVHIYLILL